MWWAIATCGYTHVSGFTKKKNKEKKSLSLLLYGDDWKLFFDYFYFIVYDLRTVIMGRGGQGWPVVINSIQWHGGSYLYAFKYVKKRKKHQNEYNDECRKKVTA